MCILDLTQHRDCLLVLYLHSVTRIPVVILNPTNISRAPTARSTQVSTLLEACSFENTSCEYELGRGWAFVSFIPMLKCVHSHP